jgi:hypothetical protein
VIAGGKMGLEDAACNKLTELALNDVEVAGSVLREAVSSSAFAVQAVSDPDVHKAFQQVWGCTVRMCLSQ